MEDYNLAVSNYNTVNNGLIDTKEALKHLKLIQSQINSDAGYIELRTFAERADAKMADKFARSYFIPTDADIKQIEAAVDWGEIESGQGRGVFVGLNPRSREQGTKDAVKSYSSAFLDLDLDKRGINREDAIAEIRENSPIPPTYISESGGGLHVAYYFKPTDDASKWTALQETLYDKFQHIGADRSVVTDESRVLRLTGFPNWKYEKPRDAKIVEFTSLEVKPSFNQMATLFDVNFDRAGERKRHELPEQIDEGGRNSLLHKEASRLRHWGYEQPEIEAAVLEINKTRCNPPLLENEVVKIAESVAKRYPKDHDVLQSSEPATEIFTSANLFKSWGEMSETDYTPPEYLIYGLPRGSVGGIIGVTNFGKSSLLRNLAISLASGRDFLNVLNAGKPRKVLLLDYETPVDMFQEDISKMTAILSDSERNDVKANLKSYTAMEMNTPYLNLTEDVYFKAIEKEITSYKPDVIIVDTISAAFSIKNENDNGEITELMKRLQRLAKNANAVVLFAHHIGKAGSEQGNASNSHYRARGASAFHGSSLAVIQLDEKSNSGAKLRTMKYAKVKAKEPGEVVLRISEESRWFEIDGSTTVINKADESYHKILEIIKKPMKIKEIVDESGLSRSTVEKYLKRGVDTNKLQAIRGVYQPHNHISFGETETIH